MSNHDLTGKRGVTLNDLLEEQQALNMRMLLAVQLRDLETQKELQAALEKVAEQIDRMISGSLKS